MRILFGSLFVCTRLAGTSRSKLNLSVHRSSLNISNAFTFFISTNPFSRVASMYSYRKLGGELKSNRARSFVALQGLANDEERERQKENSETPGAPLVRRDTARKPDPRTFRVHSVFTGR